MYQDGRHNNSPEMIDELFRLASLELRQIKFQPLALIATAFRRSKKSYDARRRVAVKRSFNPEPEG